MGFSFSERVYIARLITAIAMFLRTPRAAMTQIHQCSPQSRPAAHVLPHSDITAARWTRLILYLLYADPVRFILVTGLHRSNRPSSEIHCWGYTFMRRKAISASWQAVCRRRYLDRSYPARSQPPDQMRGKYWKHSMVPE